MTSWYTGGVWPTFSLIYSIYFPVASPQLTSLLGIDQSHIFKILPRPNFKYPFNLSLFKAYKPAKTLFFKDIAKILDLNFGSFSFALAKYILAFGRSLKPA